ncbi:MAG: hypothetical protein K8T89_19050 [Planctomycetes bacterium]|nr:hypothetical protein [Planctomycetota bacterium]
MPMPPYPVICYAPGCQNEAVYKIAARWSDGITGELKTYSLVCKACLPELYRQARIKRDGCRLAAGESLDVPAIFQLDRGERDRQLVRCEELEKQLAG